MKKVILSLLVLSTILVSCKKDDKNCDLNAGNFAGTYKITAVTYKANTSAATIDEFATYSACEKDDLVIFNTNNTTTYTDAGVVCTPNNSGTGVWSFSGSTVTIDSDVYTVAAFSCSGTTITQSGPAAGELYTITLAKQ